MNNVKKGVVALPTILLIGGIILEIGLALALVTYLLLQSGAGNKFSAEALVAAQTGVDDSLMRIIRNGNIGSPSAYSYSINLDALRKADVVVCKDFKIADNSCDVSQPNIGVTHIISTGKAFNKYRRLQAFAGVNPNNSEVRIISVQEISF